MIKKALLQLIETVGAATALAVDMQSWLHSPMAFVSFAPQGNSVNRSEGGPDPP